MVEEFIFRLPTGEEVGSAKNLEEFPHLIEDVPKCCLESHHSGEHFKPWLSALGHEELAIELAKIEARGMSFEENFWIELEIIQAVRNK